MWECIQFSNLQHVTHQWQNFKCVLSLYPRPIQHMRSKCGNDITEARHARGAKSGERGGQETDQSRPIRPFGVTEGFSNMGTQIRGHHTGMFGCSPLLGSVPILLKCQVVLAKKKRTVIVSYITSHQTFNLGLSQTSSRLLWELSEAQKHTLYWLGKCSLVRK
jgi:hypothetical protein